ncbi:helix-turn-helix transcriptional regulator [Fulvivirga sp. M361]|uniref:helix-turn-helix domain-containing protein n=1 Tax=Fulvivirga sp. M361 TaxID=2594266 RepID=UPI00117BBD1A|nr:AraC family transcriptional regulator [Fulvivirga sp. M361]TRX60088.1 helix-turn-helix transcriptional regulator [Fulvivirga sp. M361]
MIVNHKTIDLFDKPLFTWVNIRTPMETSVPLPSEACFAYIIDGDDQVVSFEDGIRVEAGQAILSLCGQMMGHTLSEQEYGQFTSIIVHFHKEVLLKVYENGPPPFWKELEEPVTQYIVQMAASELVKQYFAGVACFFHNREAISQDILILKLKEIILLLLQTKDAPVVTKIMSSLFSQRTFGFKEIVEAHICGPVTTENLALLTNRSISTFKREFKKIYNTTPGNYIINKRVEKVAKLLKVSDESISSVGYECGFSSPAHLSRVFKTKYGMTPSEYRLNLSDK